jgi:hypothetical protein
MPSLKRAHVYLLRSEIHSLELKLKGQGKNQKDESERDLIATACVALWDLDIKHLLSCLRRLIFFRKAWATVYDNVLAIMVER